MSEPKRTARLSPDRPWVGGAAIILVMLVMLSSMVFSYVGIAEAAAWTGVPIGIHAIAPIFIDGAIITYTVSLTIFEWRREGRRTIRHTRRVLWGFTALSVGLNFAHTASYWAWDFTIREAWFGSLISIAAPIAALLSAEEVVRLAFRRHAEHLEDVQSSEAERETAPAAEVAPTEELQGDEPAVATIDAPLPVPHGEVLIRRESVAGTAPVHLPSAVTPAEDYSEGEDATSMSLDREFAAMSQDPLLREHLDYRR